jgi:signal transduction histidine kinase
MAEFKVTSSLHPNPGGLSIVTGLVQTPQKVFLSGKDLFMGFVAKNLVKKYRTTSRLQNKAPIIVRSTGTPHSQGSNDHGRPKGIPTQQSLSTENSIVKSMLSNILGHIETGIILLDSKLDGVYSNIESVFTNETLEYSNVRELINVGLVTENGIYNFKRIFLKDNVKELTVDLLSFQIMTKIYDYCRGKSLDPDFGLPGLENSIKELRLKEDCGLISMHSQINPKVSYKNEEKNLGHVNKIQISELVSLMGFLFAAITAERALNTDDYLFLENWSHICFFYKDISIKIALLNLSIEPMVCVSLIDLGDRVLLLNLDDKNKFKNLILMSISHELKTPMNFTFAILEMFIDEIHNLQGIIQDLQQQNRGQENILVSADTINKLTDTFSLIKDQGESVMKNLHHMMLVIQSTEDYTKIQTGRLQLAVTSVNIFHTVKGILKIYSEQTKSKKLQTKVITDEPNLIWPMDKRILKEILSIIIFNSVKYTFTGSIHISILPDPKTQTLQLIIEDTGVGITETQLSILQDILVNT